jgi:hypothetical protein
MKRILLLAFTALSPALPALADEPSALKTYQCSSSALGANYLTRGFASAKDLGTIRADWQAWIKATHPMPGVQHSNCREVTPKEAEGALRQVGFTHVDWTDE